MLKKLTDQVNLIKSLQMIEESEKLKSSLESKAEHLADRLVPYTLVGTALTYLLTRNATKALSVLMVDFSCALKLAMPISVFISNSKRQMIIILLSKVEILRGNGRSSDNRI